MTDRYATNQGVFHITPKPGMPSIAILHGVYVLPECRGKGNGHKLMDNIVLNLQLGHYDQAICTTAGDNIAMQACLQKACWQLLTSFHNRRTNGVHQLWGITLTRSTP